MERTRGVIQHGLERALRLGQLPDSLQPPRRLLPEVVTRTAAQTEPVNDPDSPDPELERLFEPSRVVDRLAAVDVRARDLLRRTGLLGQADGLATGYDRPLELAQVGVDDTQC